MTASYTVPTEEDGARLDRLLPKIFPALSFALVQKLCRKGQIRVDGRRVKGAERLAAGQEVKLPPSLVPVAGDEGAPTLSPAEATRVAGWILHREADFLILNKPYGLPVQAGSGHSRSVDRALTALFATHGEDIHPRLTHRLDRDTTGCLAVALNRQAAETLTRAFRGREVAKTYWAVVSGTLSSLEGEISLPLAKEGGQGRERMVVAETGQKALTRYRHLGSWRGNIHWLEAEPLTGRTHQIRAHLAAIGLPILGDTKYGGDPWEGDKKMFLHARALAFPHPKSGELFRVEAPPPAHFLKIFREAGWK